MCIMGTLFWHVRLATMNFGNQLFEVAWQASVTFGQCAGTAHSPHILEARSGTNRMPPREEVQCVPVLIFWGAYEEKRRFDKAHKLAHCVQESRGGSGTSRVELWP